MNISSKKRKFQEFRSSFRKSGEKSTNEKKFKKDEFNDTSIDCLRKLQKGLNNDS